MEPSVQLDKKVKRTGDYSFIFNHLNQDSFVEALQEGLALVQKKMLTTTKPFTGIQPKELEAQFKGLSLDESLDSLSEALQEVEKLYLDDAVYFHHPKYMAHLNCPVVIPGLLAELVLSAVNSSMDTWDQSAGGSFMEQKLIDWTCEKIGLGKEADGIFTSGGSQSNLMAMLLARDHYCWYRLAHHTKVDGLPPEASRFRVFASQASHFSIQKSLAMLGMGYNAVVTVPCDQNFKMDAKTLEAHIERCLAEGLLPMAIVATAGTTDFGSIDPMEEISQICKKYGIWMHVDAAYGCGLLVSPTHRGLLEGIQHADSVTVDYHKSFFQPISCSAFFAREKKNFATVTHHADYLNPLDQMKADTPTLINKSIQSTKRFDALKLWLTLRSMGAENIGKTMDKVMDLAQQAYRLMQQEPNIELVHQPELSTLVFRYRPTSLHDEKLITELNIYIRKAIFQTGEAAIASTKFEGRQYLKFTLLNPVTSLQDIKDILNMIQLFGQEYFNQ